MSRPPRSTTATPFSQSRSEAYNNSNNGNQPLLSLQDGFAHIDPDGEIHVGRHPSSVVYRKRTVSSQPLGRSSPMVPDGRYTQLSKDFTFGLANKQDSEHTDSVLHGWQETKARPDDRNQTKKVAPGLEGSVASLKRKKLQATSSNGIVIRGGKHLRTQAVDPSQMKVAGVCSNKQIQAGSRFANNSSNLSSPGTPMRTNSPDRGSNNNSVMSSNSRYAASASNINVIGSDMGSLVAHDYRYAWVAQKLAEHEEIAQRESSRRVRSNSPAVFSSSSYQQQQPRRTSSASGQRRRASSAGVVPRRISNTPSQQEGNDDHHYQEEAEYYYQQQQQNSSVVFPSAHHHHHSSSSANGGGMAIGPSGRLVTHYPKLVNERVHDSNVRIYGDRPHPKEYFTMKQFKNVPSRYSGNSAHAFAKGGVQGETTYFQ